MFSYQKNPNFSYLDFEKVYWWLIAIGIVVDETMFQQTSPSTATRLPCVGTLFCQRLYSDTPYLSLCEFVAPLNNTIWMNHTTSHNADTSFDSIENFGSKHIKSNVLNETSLIFMCCTHIICNVCLAYACYFSLA